MSKTKSEPVSTAKRGHRLETHFDTVKLIIVASCGMPELMTVEISGQQHLGNLAHQRKMLCISGFSSNSSNGRSQCKLPSWIKSGQRLLREWKPHLVYSPTMYWLLHIHKGGLHWRKCKKSNKTPHYRDLHQTKTGTTLTATGEPGNFRNHCFGLKKTHLSIFCLRQDEPLHHTHKQMSRLAHPLASCLSAKFLYPHRACIPAATSETEALPQPHVAFLPLPFLSLCS